MDEQMAKLETMDEDDFERLREKRKLQMQKQAAERQKNMLNGHGRYMELSDQKDFFNASKASKMILVHFYRSATWRCQIIDRHLGDLAPAHLETRVRQRGGHWRVQKVYRGAQGGKALGAGIGGGGREARDNDGGARGRCDTPPTELIIKVGWLRRSVGALNTAGRASLSCARSTYCFLGLLVMCNSSARLTRRSRRSWWSA